MARSRSTESGRSRTVPGQDKSCFRSSVSTNPCRHKNSSFTNHPEFQESCHQAMGKHGGCQRGHHPQIHQRPDSVIPEAAFDGRGHRGGGPSEELTSGQQFLRQLPEWARWAEETAFIVDIFSHAAQAHEHLSEVCANITALAKITDKTTLMSIINGVVRPLVQLNIPEGFLNPIEDKKALTSEEEKKEKVKEMVLPIPNATCLKHEPRNSPTRILTVAVWLKMSRKYFNEGTVKEACERFNVRVKQLS